jgi:hypothetical protein
VPPFWVMTGCCDTGGWLGSGGTRGDLDGKSARCHPGHHRDAVRIAVDGAIDPEDDRRALRRDAVDGQLNGVTLSLPRTLPSPNTCLVTNVTDDPAGSMAYRPAGGACTAVLAVDMTGSFLVGSGA